MSQESWKPFGKGSPAKSPESRWRQDEVESIGRGEELGGWGWQGGETKGPCRQTGGEGRGGVLRWGAAFWQDWVEGEGESGENGVRPASGRGPGQPPASTARHEWDARTAALSWKWNTMGDESGGAN